MLAGVGDSVNENTTDQGAGILRQADSVYYRKALFALESRPRYTMRQPTWLTNIIVVPLFSNILGILSVFVHVAGVILPLSLADHLPRNFPQGVLVIPALFLVPLALGAFDWWWRLKQAEPDRWQKLLSPVHGGCLLLVPLWALNWGAILFVLGVILVAWTSRLLR
jgi:hypothetical protein